MEIGVGSKRFEDEYRKNEGNVHCSVVVWKIEWKRKVSGPVVYVRRELAIIWFCAMVARNGFINDVVEWNGGSLRNASQSFISRCCKVDRPITDGLNTDLHLDIGNGVSLEKVDKYCYLGDMLDADGGCDSAVTARVRSAWKKFREYLPILTGKGFSLKVKGKVRSCLMHGSETWPMKVEHELKMNRTEMSMIRLMCGVKLNERKKSEELWELLGLEPVSLVIKNSRLRWFGHVERKDDNDWVKH